MNRRHLVAFVTLSAWTVFAVWVGAESFDVGECLSIAFIVSGLWIAFAALGSASNEREGRCALFSLPLLLVVAWAAQRRVPDYVALDSRAGETQHAFVMRFVHAVALSECR